MRASVVVCAVGPNRRLHWAIRSAILQTVPGRDYEIIVAEGEAGSRSETERRRSASQAVAAAAVRSPVVLRYVYVPGGDLKDVIATGREAARAKFVAILRPDEVASPEWLQRLLESGGGDERGSASGAQFG